MNIPSLYVCSLESFSGKSAFCLGLALILREKGYKVGYFKPIGCEMTRSPTGEKIDEDAQLMKDVLNLDVTLDVISPIVLGIRFLEESTKIQPRVYQNMVLQAYKKASEGMELMILEGPYSLGLGTSIGLDPTSLTQKLKSQIILISRVIQDEALDRLILGKKYVESLGGMFLGAVLSFVPQTSIERIKGFGTPILKKHGVDVLGIIPDAVSLRAPTVGEICEKVPCTVLTCKDKMDVLVEEFLVGAMNPESALSYFRRSLRKAVITGGDRTDIQFAALQTDTSVLILTGNIYPDVRVLARAEEEGVPVLLVPHNTYSAVKEISDLSGRIKSEDTHKINLAQDLIQKHVDWQTILNSLLKE